MRLNPLWNWDREDTLQWIEKKKKEFMKYRGMAADEIEQEEEEEEEEEDEVEEGLEQGEEYPFIDDIF